ncbi:MAG: hypothetical protein M1818_006790 [Claussenomyces sp. TS43310]|nr:MAG: hypothetical protein M1818_006790 [Claussenomyces sp. TS43310]
MTKEDLDSDRVNYLIWRYLQESNYLDTAVNLQKEWNVPDPQQHFDFAPHVRHHTLVHVLQRGLLYSEAERIELQARRNGVELPGFFGPLTPRSPPAVTVDEDALANIRKRQIETSQMDLQLRNESPAKRARLSNGYENGFEPAPVPMDIDAHTNGNGHAYPSPKEVERPLTPITTTNGPAQGTQVEKVTELSSDTTFLSLGEDPTCSKSIILHCEWSPTDPAILAAAGSDALVRLWTISRGASGGDPHMHVNGITPPYQDIGEDEPAPNASVTALAWSPDGTTFAYATESVVNDFGSVGIWSTDGTHVHTFSGFEPPVIALKWNPSSQLILAVMPDKEGTAITIFAPATQISVIHSISRHDPEEPLEVTWTGEYEFIVCGGETLWAFQCADGTISLFKKYETRQDHGLSQITYDAHTGLVATASDSGVIDVGAMTGTNLAVMLTQIQIWDQQGRCHTISAHQGAIVSLLWQPISPHSLLDANSERFLASSGEDGIISIWDARAESKAKCSMTMDSGVVALAYTPDGAFIAGATGKQILIWRVDDVSIPRARWIRGAEPGWVSPRMSDTSQDEDHHCLCWDADGQKLAYAVNCQLGDEANQSSAGRHKMATVHRKSNPMNGQQSPEIKQTQNLDWTIELISSRNVTGNAARMAQDKSWRKISRHSSGHVLASAMKPQLDDKMICRPGGY